MSLPMPTISLDTSGSASTPNSNMGSSSDFLSPSSSASSKRLPPPSSSTSLLPPPVGLNVPPPAGVFPLPNSQQVASGSATGNPRNKVSLKPGFSMMDWLRLTKSGKDLTGVGGPRVGGKVREISRKELKRHNSPRDAWMAINGMVFNVSAYLDFHPGGRDELMKGAGIDATELFNQVHRWVNYESMLASCLVGKLVEGDVLLTPSKSEMPSPVIPPIVRPTGPVPPTTDYIQMVDKVTLNIYTKRKGLSSDQVIVDNSCNSVRILVYLLDGTAYIAHYQLYAEVKSGLVVRVGASSGKVEVTLVKMAPARWLALGKPLDKHNWFGKVEEMEVAYRSWRIVEVKEATHDTRYVVAEPPPGCHFTVPPGHHVHMAGDVEGMEVLRSYTPVRPLEGMEVVRSYTPVRPLSTDDEGTYSGQAAHFLIKIYKDGCFTKIVEKLAVGDTVRLSDHTGSFVLSKVGDLERVFLLAAGTGVTPIVRLLPILPHVPTTLLYFNKTKKDIIWEKELAVFERENDWLKIVHVLSQEPSYDGARGRISRSLLEELMWGGGGMEESRVGGKKEKRLVCVCGMTEFTREADRLFREEFGFEEEEIHLFAG